MDSKTLKIFPFSDPEHLEEVVTVTEDNFLPQSWINGETKSARKTGVYILELFHSYFTDTNDQTKKHPRWALECFGT